MRFLILCLLLYGCTPDTMIISDASEIQFTATGQSSFNLETMGFTDDYCFHQKFLCTSQRRFQGYGADDLDAYLIAFDEDGAVLFNEAYTKSTNLFLQALIDGVNDPLGVGTAWTLGAAPTVSVSGALGSSMLYYLKIYGAETLTDYDFLLDITRSISVTGQINIYIVDQNYYDTGLGSPLGSFAMSADVQTYSYTGVAGVPAYLAVEVFNTSGTTSALINSIAWDGAAETLITTYSLEMTPSDESMCDKKVQFKIFDGNDPETDDELFYSDFIDFVSTWANSPSSGRILIQYKSIQNFADLIYNSTSEYFNIELEGRFRKERKITAQKTLELTEMVLNTAASL